MVQRADMTRVALYNVTREGRRLREYILVAKAAFDATDGEAIEAKAVAAVTQVELTGDLGFAFFAP